MSMTAAQHKLKCANERRRKFGPALIRALRGKRLVNSRVFNLVELVWSLHNQPRKSSDEQSDAERQFEFSLRPMYEAELARRLLQAIIACDVGTLQEVVQTVDLLGDVPRDGKSFVMVNRLHHVLLTYFLLHDTGMIEELLAWVCPRMGWVIGKTGEREAYDKKIRRACDKDHLDISIASSDPGPKLGSKRRR